VSSWAAPLAEAYAACDKLARSHYENFPVASRLLPAAMRPHVAALYAFARVADDIADEGEAPPASGRPASAGGRPACTAPSRRIVATTRAGGNPRADHERSRGADSRRDRPLDPDARSARRVVR
jgi:hypothetical protein